MLHYISNMPSDSSSILNSPIYGSNCWYIPHGKKMISGSRRGVVTVYPGVYLIHDKENGQEVRRIPLHNDIHFASYTMFPVSGIDYMGGHKLSRYNTDYQVVFGHPISAAYGGMPGSLDKVDQFQKACRQAIMPFPPRVGVDDYIYVQVRRGKREWTLEASLDASTPVRSIPSSPNLEAMRRQYDMILRAKYGGTRDKLKVLYVIEPRPIRIFSRLVEVDFDVAQTTSGYEAHNKEQPNERVTGASLDELVVKIEQLVPDKRHHIVVYFDRTIADLENASSTLVA